MFVDKLMKLLNHTLLWGMLTHVSTLTCTLLKSEYMSVLLQML